MNSIFTGSKIKNYIEVMQNCCKEALPSMDKAAETNADILILEMMMSYTTDVIGKFQKYDPLSFIRFHTNISLK